MKPIDFFNRFFFFIPQLVSHLCFTLTEEIGSAVVQPISREECAYMQDNEAGCRGYAPAFSMQNLKQKILQYAPKAKKTKHYTLP